MKKRIIVFAFLLLSLASHAQIVSSSSLVITKAKLPDVERGYEQSVDASAAIAMDYLGTSVNLTYIGGYRFNSHIFLGAGTGFNMNTEARTPVYNSSNGGLNLPILSIPLFVHFRAYFLKTRVSPFFAFSAGGRFSTSKSLELELGDVDYSTVGAFVNPELGVNCRLNAKHSLYVSAGWTWTTVPYARNVEFDSATVYNRLCNAANVHIGFTF